ncbi:MAG: hypothetical protein HXY50_11150 [Ignavibacteriaceae bacterium]|nr:hypothetical protein [Ignavibacteriaceae bacterium]
MAFLSLESFYSADRDLELNQYHILAGIKDIKNEFKKKKLYPSFSNLLNLTSQLQDIVQQKKDLEIRFAKKIKSFDFKNNKVIFESVENEHTNIDCLFDLIEWSLPQLKNLIEEALVICEYVENNLTIEQVGILPIYKSEGYFIIPNNEISTLQVHKFECSLFTSDDEKYRALKTKLLRTYSNDVIRLSLENIKRELISEYEELPNPATFKCETELDFPFVETVFPIAKRKLISTITQIQN